MKNLNNNLFIYIIIAGPLSACLGKTHISNLSSFKFTQARKSSVYRIRIKCSKFYLIVLVKT